ncbi:MAG: M20/M25/M40 family metallo-hydrolase [Balneolaceae bacterium]|nr:M20/M25/M40 family metallo-hydrolase [Balneolaceae bacterium]
MMIKTSTSLHTEAIELLKKLIATPSLSKKEDDTAEAIIDFLESHGVATQRLHNNIWATNKHFEVGKPTLLLNSHHDTVKPNDGYTRDPHGPKIEDGKLFGLGSNDAGGPLISLMATFLHFHDRKDLGGTWCSVLRLRKKFPVHTECAPPVMCCRNSIVPSLGNPRR